MKFPITRESLQAFDYAKEQQEIKEEEIEKSLSLILQHLFKQFQQSMPSISKEKKFIWRNMLSIKQLSPGGSIGDMEKAVHLPRFIEKLKETFVGCDIIVDPLKTYIIIDWS